MRSFDVPEWIGFNVGLAPVHNRAFNESMNTGMSRKSKRKRGRRNRDWVVETSDEIRDNALGGGTRP